jgi:amino acid transporter
VHPRFRTPDAAIVVLVLLALALALTGSFVQLAMLSVVARLVTYVGTAAAVPVLRKKLAGRAGALELPGGVLIPVLALALSFVFLASADSRDLAAGAVALGVGAVIYKLRRG